ncbi:hypothetical protein PM082_004308 [Marasmius tenuissimus]|nr:hypothetical protein PM082_004308 [Marasmius tenuissimus]
MDHEVDSCKDVAGNGDDEIDWESIPVSDVQTDTEEPGTISQIEGAADHNIHTATGQTTPMDTNAPQDTETRPLYTPIDPD